MLSGNMPNAWVEQEKVSRMFIAIVGNPVDGFDFFGPFDSIEDAIDWGTMLKQHYNIASLASPK